MLMLVPHCVQVYGAADIYEDWLVVDNHGETLASVDTTTPSLESTAASVDSSSPALNSPVVDYSAVPRQSCTEQFHGNVLIVDGRTLGTALATCKELFKEVAWSVFVCIAGCFHCYYSCIVDAV